MQRSHAHGLAILNFGAIHILGFWVRVIPPSHQLNNPQFWSSTGAYPEISLDNEIMRMISIFWEISKFEAMAARAH